ncbi:unnamed protein product, partial [Allacma fusca]
ARVIAITSDSAPVMVAMQKEVVKTHPGLLSYPCNPHMLNLLCHDVIPAETSADVNRVNKTFRSKTKLKARLKRLGGV